jgi:hypothetical protein
MKFIFSEDEGVGVGDKGYGGMELAAASSARLLLV